MRLTSLLLPSFITRKLVHVKNFILGVLIEFLTWKVMLAQGEGRRREYMKGGEEHMLHIIVWNGTVTHVYLLNEDLDKPDTRLEEEFDYKVEYNETGVKPKSAKIKKGKDGWIKPLLYKGETEEA
jgi:hypothetical protein